ncbi:hypothetical protein P154DRAFT_616321 [Amniculicola lignicola CBS 123094]|uniref:Uncharacterized protein n=1 Tax=Amniculicola lignicola CBS 123094 TaxID=1392246 RepID=A0A6A5X2I4_9PLEO|nr:hypothetical protein P154DRAFT_616321 [Amniculicola lignicola CBS 123094]
MSTSSEKKFKLIVDKKTNPREKTYDYRSYLDVTIRGQFEDWEKCAVLLKFWRLHRSNSESLHHFTQTFATKRALREILDIPDLVEFDHLDNHGYMYDESDWEFFLCRIAWKLKTPLEEIARIVYPGMRDQSDALKLLKRQITDRASLLHDMTVVNEEEEAERRRNKRLANLDEANEKLRNHLAKRFADEIKKQELSDGGRPEEDMSLLDIEDEVEDDLPGTPSSGALTALRSSPVPPPSPPEKGKATAGANTALSSSKAAQKAPAK